MIRRLLHRSEIAELRDRAVNDAKHIAHLEQTLTAERSQNARLVAHLDQTDTTLRNIHTGLTQTGHHGRDPRCIACNIVALITTHRHTLRDQP